MSIDEQFTDHVRKETLEARAGQQGMLRQDEVEAMHKLWEVIASRHYNGVSLIFSREKLGDMYINISEEHEEHLKKLIPILEITRVNTRRCGQDVEWRTDNVIFKLVRLIGRRKDHLLEPNWIEYETYADHPVLFSHQRETLDRLERINRQPISNNVRPQGPAADIDYTAVELRIYTAWREQFGHLEDNEEANLFAMHSLVQEAMNYGMDIQGLERLLREHAQNYDEARRSQ